MDVTVHCVTDYNSVSKMIKDKIIVKELYSL